MRHEAGRSSLARMPGLDGLRGLAVLGVLAYHLDTGWLPGGFLGVSLFFTLSGFLITSLLVREHDASGSVALAAFWARRARRLLPAALLGLLLAVVVGAAAGTAEQLAVLPGDVAGALGYVANWRFVATHTAYGAGYVDPSLLEHYWSLAIEEQYYVFFPLLFIAATRRRALLPVLALLAVLSAATSVLLFDPLDTARTYFGTDTRAGELLLGALLAAVLARRPTPGGAPMQAIAPWLTNTSGAVALCVTAALWATVTPADAWLHRGGFLAVGATSAALILGAAATGPVPMALGWRPLCWVGSISYGLYVYHWPIFQAIDAERTGHDGVALAAMRLLPTLLLAWASARWIEQPIRAGRLPLGGRQQLGLAAGAALLLGGCALLASDLAGDRAIARTTPAIQLGQSPPTTAPPRVVEPPRQVLVIGDSLLHQGLPTLRDRFALRGVQVEAIGGPSEHLMFQQAAWLLEVTEAIEKADPDVVILQSCCGLGSARRDEVYLLPTGDVAAPDTDPTWAEWRRLADAITHLARANGAATLWVLAPPADTGGFYGPVEERIRIANELYRDVASCRGDVGLVDWGLLANADGSYAAELLDTAGVLVKVRADDGLHFTLDGQALLADLTVAATFEHWQQVGGRAPLESDLAGVCAGARAGADDEDGG